MLHGLHRRATRATLGCLNVTQGCEMRGQAVEEVSRLVVRTGEASLPWRRSTIVGLGAFHRTKRGMRDAISERPVFNRVDLIT